MTTPPGRTPDPGSDPDAGPPQPDPTSGHGSSPGQPAGGPHQPSGGSPYPPYPSGQGQGGSPDQPGGSPYQPGGGSPYGGPGDQPGGSPYPPGGSPYGGPPDQPGGLPYPPSYPGQPGSPPGGPPYGWGAYPPPPGAPGAGQPGEFGVPPWGEPPSRRSRRPLFVLLGVLAAVAVLLVAAVSTVAVRGGGTPRETADKFLAALKDKDVQRAHDLLCSDGKRKKSADSLRDDFELKNHTITTYVITNDRRTRQRDGKTETLVDATLTYETGDKLAVHVGVWKEGSQRICSLESETG